MACKFNGVVSDKGLQTQLQNYLNGSIPESLKVFSIVSSKRFQDWFNKKITGFEITGEPISEDALPNLVLHANMYFDETAMTVSKERVGQSNERSLFDTVATERHVLSVLSNMYLRAEDFLIAKGRERTLTNIRNMIRSTVRKHLYDNYDTLSESQIELGDRILAMIDAEDDALIQKVIRQPKVLALSKQLKVLDNTVTDDEATPATAEDNEEDGYFKSWEDVDKRNFADTVSRTVKRIFETQRRVSGRISDTGEVVYDDDTPTGMAEPINFIDYYRTIKNNGVFDNVESFLDSLEDIARTIPDRLALFEIVKSARANPNIANVLYVNFSQPTISRNEFRFNNGNERTITTSNQNATPVLVVRNEMLSVLNNNYGIDTSVPYTYVRNLRSQLNAKRKAVYRLYDGTTVDSVDEYIWNALHFMGFDIPLTAVEGYLKHSFNSNALGNLIDSITHLMSEYGEVQLNNRHNKAVYDAAKKELSNRKKLDNPDIEIPTHYTELVKAEDIKPIVSLGLQRRVMEIATMLSPFMDVHTEFNSRSIDGEMVGDVIKNSYITKLFQTIQNKAALTALVNSRPERQYRYSNIFRNQTKTAANGKLINIPGLVTNTMNGAEPSELSKEVMQVELFNGTANTTLGETVGYSNMTPSDFDITMIMEYLNPNPITAAKQVTPAKYFTATPSDAGKTFIITSYKLDSKGLAQKVETMPDGSPIGKVYNVEVSQVFGKTGKREDIQAPTIIDAIESGERTAYTRFNSDGYIGDWIKVPEGTLIRFRDKGREAIVRVTKKMSRLAKNEDVAAWSKKEGFTEEFFNDNVKPEISNGAWQLEFEYVPTVKTTNINHDHAIHVALKNIILQEIENMRQAYETIFDLDDAGNLQYDDPNVNDLSSKPTPRLKKDSKLYRFYHTKKGSAFDSNGNLTGNVFEFWNLVADGTSSDSMLNPNKWLSDKSATAMHSFLYGGSTELDVQIDDYVDSYIRYKSDEAVKYYSNYKDSVDLVGTNYTNYDEAIREMALNYTIQYNNFADLFDGEAKFYKDPVTTIKRFKQTQGSGLIYSAYNIDPTKNGDVLTTLNIAGKMLPVERTFRYATVYNVEKSSENITGIRRILEHAKIPANRVDKILKRYEGMTTPDDGQSYVTLDEFAKRMWLAGEYDNYKGIFEKLFAKEPLTGAEIDRFIQVQKNFYYDIAVNGSMGLAVPTQIKNAEFVLIPQYVQGTSLEAIYNTMVKNNIGQLNNVETEKSAINDILTLYDAKGNISEASMTQFDNNLAAGSVKIGNYSSLYRQQDTPQHVDGENKAGIQVVKKMLDNLPGTWGEEKRQRYFDLMGSNIQASFEELAVELGLKLDEDGRFAEDADGNPIIDVDYSRFYDMVADELIRTGANSNIMEYATLNELGVPNMPSWMPAVRKKIQNVTQSIFTNTVTKQKLPGFHAVQVSGVGFHEYENKYTQTTFEDKYGQLARKLEYHKNGEPYIEVMLPMWASKWYGRDITIEDLEAAGLTDMIGYRVPTEGKQSITRMKVVGLLHESYGSTIVVPDEWVTQTGADFDVDTIYGIYYESYINKDGKPQKVKYLDSSSDAFERYAAYVNDRVNQRIVKANRQAVNGSVLAEAKRHYKERIAEATDDLRNYYQEEIDRAMAEENDVYADSSEVVRDTMKQVYADNPSKFEDGKMVKPKFATMVKKYIEALRGLSTESNTEVASDAARLLQQYEKIDGIIGQQQALESRATEMFFEYYNDYKDEYFQDIRKDAIIRAADASGLVTFAKFQTMPMTMQNSRAARNNAILDNMMDIISDIRTAEEMFTGSNFDDIISAREEVYSVLGIDKEWIDIKSPIGQANYRNQTMSGYTLKAISVKRDTFDSVSNVAKSALPHTEKGISVRYKKSDVEDVERLEKRYPGLVKDLGDFVEVEHRYIGWSDDNLNVIGKTTTVYSSETTAWILDNVKAGGVRNVNLETFDVFKTLVDMGIDYNTAIAFMNQPAIDEVIRQNNKTDSVFAKYHADPVRAAEQQLLTNYFGGRVTARTAERHLAKLGLMVTDKKGSTRRKVHTITLNKDELLRHLRPNSDVANEESIKYQLSVLETYEAIKDIADGIASYGNVTNLDKIGAGQSLTQVHNTISNIQDLKDGKGRGVSLVSMGKTHSNKKGDEVYMELAEAIYPDGNFNSIDPNKSVYPTLAYHYKYSMLASDNIVGKMFTTENANFRRLKDLFPTNDEQSIFNLENYVITVAMSNSNFVLTSSIVRDGVVYDNTNPDPYTAQQRIYGFGQDIVHDFDFADQTGVNVNRWLQLSPGNKLMLLKNKVRGDSVLNFLVPTLMNTRNETKKLPSPHIIKVYDNSTDEETLFELFRDLYYKDNIWYKTMAQDLIRYSVLVEGMQYKFNNVSKIIPAEILYNSESLGGTNLINESQTMLDTMIFDKESCKTIIDKFFRTYSNDKYIPKYENKYTKSTPKGRITFDVFGNDVAILDRHTAESVGLIEQGSNVVKPYIWTNKFEAHNKKPTLRLYKTFVKNVIPAQQEGHFVNNKVDKNGMAIEVILYPVNRLERNETNAESVNAGNNIYAPASTIYNSLEYAYDGRGGRGQVVSNSVSSLYRAVRGIGRNYITLTRETRDTIAQGLNRELIKEAMHTMAVGEIQRDGSMLAYGDGDASLAHSVIAIAKDGDVNKQLDALKSNPDGLNHYGRIIVEEGATAKAFINAFEEAGYTRYSVVGGGSNSGVIKGLNDRDAKLISRERIDALSANRVHVDTSSGIYQQLMSRLQNSRIDANILDNKSTFIAIAPMMVTGLGLQEGTRTIVHHKGKRIVLTNIGLVTSRSASIVSNYKDYKKNIDSVVKEGTKYYGINAVALIQADEYNNAVSSFVDDADFESSLGELDETVDKFIVDTMVGINNTIKFENDEMARRTRTELNNLRLDMSDGNVLDNSERLAALATLAHYNARRAIFLEDKINHFVRIAPVAGTAGVDMSINDPELFERMVDNVDMQNKFVHLINSVHEFVTDSKTTSDLETYDITKAKDDEDLQFMLRANDYINDIQSQFGGILSLDNKVRKAINLFFNNIIASMSTDPNVQSGLRSILEPYRDESYFFSWAGNIQESNVPLIQIIVNKLVASARKAQMLGDREHALFAEQYEAIKQAHPGTSWESLIDPKTGYLIMPYTQDLQREVRKHRENLQVLGKRFGLDSAEYRAAKQEEEEYLTKNTIRPFVKPYYDDVAAAYHILDAYPVLRDIIYDINNKKAVILRRMRDNDYTTLTTDDIKELNRLDDEVGTIKNGTHSYIMEDADVMSYVEAYYAKLDDINKTYKERILKTGFAELLEHNMTIINTSESVMSEDQLENSNTYQSAKRWLKANTYIRTSEEVAKKLKLAFSLLRSTDPNAFQFGKFVEGKKDSDGVVNGNLFTDEEVAMSKKRSTTDDDSAKNDHDEHLIRSKVKGVDNNTVYQSTFYNALKGDARTIEERAMRNEVIKKINKINSEHIQKNGRIQTANMTIEELNELAALYEQLRDIEFQTYDNNVTITKPDGTVISKTGKKRNKTRADFLKKNVRFETDYSEFAYQSHIAKSKGREYYNAWVNANMQEDIFDDDDAHIPNQYLYSTMKVVNDKWVDKNKTKAKAFINKTIKWVPTKYYWQRVREEMAKGEESFEKWREENHVWDTDINAWKPIQIWTQTELINKDASTIEAKSRWYDNKIKDEYADPAFEKGVVNPRGSDNENPEFTAIMADDGKRALYELWKSTTDRIVKDDKAKNLINKGYVPYASLKGSGKGFTGKLGQLAMSMGITNRGKGAEEKELDTEYGRRVRHMPMLSRYVKKQTIRVKMQTEDQTDAEYADYLENVFAENDAIRDINIKEHIEHSNTNYEDLLSEFIRQAVIFDNARENEDLIRLTIAKMNDMEYNVYNNRGEMLHNKSRRRITNTDTPAKAKSSRAAEHFKYFSDRLMYGKPDDDSIAAVIIRALKTLTSFKFMALNITGGTANVLLGESNIAMEAAAGTFFTVADMHAAKTEYIANSANMLANMNRETATSLTDGLIKLFHVIDLDNVIEIGTANSVSNVYKAINKTAFAQQAGGEHEMQNSALLAVLNSNKLVKNDDNYEVMSFERYKRFVREKALRKVMSDYDKSTGKHTEASFDKFNKDIRKPRNFAIAADYNDFKRDIITDFVKSLPYEVQELFIDAVNDETVHAKAEFDAMDSARSQFELKDGKAVIKEGSNLTDDHVAFIRNKVVTINHKIHGIYDQMGAARYQDTAIGAVVYQFHKHIVPQIAKHIGYNNPFGGRGRYNESREEIEKSMYSSMIGFLTTPLNTQVQYNFDTEELEIIKGMHNFGARAIEFARHLKTYYKIMPQHEQANIRRTLVETSAIVLSLIIYSIGKMLDDPDDDETQASDYAIYLADKLASELWAYTPLGAYQEAMKIYDRPVAIFGLAEDMISGLAAVYDYTLNGNEDAFYYASGTNSGKNKLSVLVQKQIPIWSQYMKHERLGKNNTYYKLGSNVLGIVPIGKWIDESKE